MQRSYASEGEVKPGLGTLGVEPWSGIIWPEQLKIFI